MRKLRKLLKVLLHIFCSFATVVAIRLFEGYDFPILTFVENIFMIRINEEFDRTIIGGIYYRMDYGSGVERIGCVRYFRSKAHFYDGSGGKNYEMRPLDEFADLSTWKYIGYGHAVSAHEDANHVYRIYWMSDRWINCYPKDK